MQKKININELIFEKIKFRYEFFSDAQIYDRMRHNKLLLDTFYPAILALNIVDPQRHKMKLQNRGSNGYAISERVAVDLGVKQLHISELITMLGFTKTDISKLLQGVKNKEYNIALVGVGGTGSNFMHWMYEMCEWVGKEEIFMRLFVADDDDYDIPNMLRIPFLPDYGRENPEPTSKKIDLLPRKFGIISKNNSRIVEKFVQNSDGNPGTLSETRLGRRNKTVVYGAPDIETRTWLTASDWTFIAATHRDNEFSIVENPAVDNDLMMETYGKITLSNFFLNHLTMTIKFLQHLKDRTEEFGTTTEAVIAREDFARIYETQIANGFKAGSKKLFALGEGVLNTQEINIVERT